MEIDDKGVESLDGISASGDEPQVIDENSVEKKFDKEEFA